MAVWFSWFNVVFLVSCTLTLNSASDQHFTKNSCNSAFGLENGEIKDDQLSANSYIAYMYFPGKGTHNAKAKYGRLNGRLAWCGLKGRPGYREDPYIQVDFGQIVDISGLAIQGLKTFINSYYVKTYTVKFSLDGSLWFNYGSPPNKVWQGSSDANTINRVFFSSLVRARYLQLLPRSSRYRICLRMEIYGCYINKAENTTRSSAISTLQPTTTLAFQPSSISTSLQPTTGAIIPVLQPSTTLPFQPSSISTRQSTCNSAFGLENGEIKDDQLSANSYIAYMYFPGKGTYNSEAKYGRLNGRLAWCGLEGKPGYREDPYIQVDFGQIVDISGLAIQGLRTVNSYYVKTYTVKFSLDGSDWFNYDSPHKKIWQGSSDANTINRVFFSNLIRARYLQLYPRSSRRRICLRMEIYGCYINKAENGTRSSTISTLQPTTTLVFQPSNLLSTLRQPTTAISILQPTTPISILQPTTPISILQPTTPILILQPTTAILILQPTTPILILQPTTPILILQPTTPISILQPTTPISILQPTTPISILQPTTPILILQPTTPILILQPTTPISILQPTTPISILQPTTPISILQPTTPILILQPTTPILILQSRSISTSLQPTTGAIIPVLEPSTTLPFQSSSISTRQSTCNSAFGLENGEIKDDQLSANSYIANMYFPDKRTHNAKAKYGRLNGRLAWCGLEGRPGYREDPYIQVDFGQIVDISGLAIQGLKTFVNSYYVKTYTVKFSLDGSHWFNYDSPHNKVWQGSTDANTINRVFFSNLVRARYLQLLPRSSRRRICLRMEIYGCYINKTVLHNSTVMKETSKHQVGTVFLSTMTSPDLASSSISTKVTLISNLARLASSRKTGSKKVLILFVCIALAMFAAFLTVMIFLVLKKKKRNEHSIMSASEFHVLNPRSSLGKTVECISYIPHECGHSV